MHPIYGIKWHIRNWAEPKLFELQGVGFQQSDAHGVYLINSLVSSDTFDVPIAEKKNNLQFVSQKRSLGIMSTLVNRMVA